MYHFVRHYEDRFGIHVNNQTVVTFLDIGTCTPCLRMCMLRIIHTLSRYNDSGGSIMLVHVTVVLQIGATSCYCLVPY